MRASRAVPPLTLLSSVPRAIVSTRVREAVHLSQTPRHTEQRFFPLGPDEGEGGCGDEHLLVCPRQFPQVLGPTPEGQGAVNSGPVT